MYDKFDMNLFSMLQTERLQKIMLFNGSVSPLMKMEGIRLYTHIHTNQT